MIKNPHLCLVYLALILIQVLNVIDVAFSGVLPMSTVILGFLHNIWAVFPDLVLTPSAILLLNVLWLCLMVAVAPFLIIGKRWAGSIVIAIALYQVSIGLYHFGLALIWDVAFKGLWSGIVQGILGLFLMLEVFGYWVTRKAS